MSQTDKRLEQLGIELPKKNRRGQGVVAVRQCGDMLFVSGHGPTDQTDPADTPIYTGKLTSLWNRVIRLRDCAVSIFWPLCGNTWAIWTGWNAL